MLAAEFVQNHGQRMLDIMYAQDEFLAHDRICATCTAAGRQDHPAAYRCRDCFGRPPACKACLLDSHTYLPFHDIQEWTSPGFFRRVSLLHLGLIIYLGHGGQPCPSITNSVPLSLRVIHSNGLHDVWVQPCQCDRAATSCRGPSTTAYQLWRSGLFPSSFDRVYDVVSLSAISMFQSLVVKARVNASAFIAALRRTSVDVFMEEQKVYAGARLATSVLNILYRIRAEHFFGPSDTSTSCNYCKKVARTFQSLETLYRQDASRRPVLLALTRKSTCLLVGRTSHSKKSDIV